MISQPNTPNLPYIPGTKKEVDAIKLQVQNIQVTCLEGEAATVDQAIKKMDTHSCIHFACHASQNIKEPLKSGFFLHDGRLEISSIIKQKFVDADFAFLSACQTSTGDETLSEEAVHLAAGMLAAGYRGVVATMWSIKDLYGPQIAEDFYANLIHQSKNLSGDDAAHALHYATQKLRKHIKPEDSDSSLLVWVPYVHFGL
jgi:CHAT domain-containing protein